MAHHPPAAVALPARDRGGRRRGRRLRDLAQGDARPPLVRRRRAVLPGLAHRDRPERCPRPGPIHGAAAGDAPGRPGTGPACDGTGRGRPSARTAPDAADQALERLGTERALRLLATLPPAQADLVALRVIVGLEPAEIALIV